MSFWKKMEQLGKKATEAALEVSAEGQKRIADFQQQVESEQVILRAEQAARKAEQEALLAEHLPDSVRFNVAANYHGGYPGLPDIIDGGQLYVSETELVWLKLPTVIRVPYQDIHDLDLDNFKVSMMRSIIGGGDNDVHRHKNTVVVICTINGVKQRVRFEIWGGLSVHSGALNAQKVVDHLAEFRHLFASDTAVLPAPAAAPTFSVADEVQRLAQLHQQGILDDEEFRAFKAKLLARL